MRKLSVVAVVLFSAVGAWAQGVVCPAGLIAVPTVRSQGPGGVTNDVLCADPASGKVTGTTKFTPAPPVANPVLPNMTTDLFNRANPLGANWTQYLNAVNPNNGAAIGAAAAQLNVAAYTGVSSGPTQASRVVMLALNGTTDTDGAAVRIGGTAHTSVSYYTCAETSTTLRIQKVVGAADGSVGTVTVLASMAVAGAAGDVITLSVVGNTLVCSWNQSATILEVNDSTSPITSGAPGVSLFNNVATISSWATVLPPPLSATYNIVFDGDSITAWNGNGAGGVDPYTSYATLPTATAYMVNLGQGNKCLGVGCAAASGGTIESMLATGTSVIDPLFNPSLGARNIVVVWGCTNDMANASRTPAQCYADLTSYVAARHAAGWRVVVVPAVSRLSASSPTTDQAMQIFDALVASNTAGADAVVTLPCSLVCTGASANALFFASGSVHLTELSHISIVAPAVSAVLATF